MIRNQAWLFAWLFLAVVAAATWPATAVDETRYLTVAWEMQAPGAWLLPQLNGEWYLQKPPLLFWLFGAGWDWFGLSVAWARLVPIVASLLGMGLIAALARRLWPHAEDVGRLAAILTGGTLIWALWSAAIMFDMLLAACVVAGALALHRAAGGGRTGMAAWAGFAVAVGLGALTKGPVIVLHLLPLALAGPWWSLEARAMPARWYLGLTLALVLGIALALAWALPAAAVAGERFGVEILWDQMARRAVQSFAHQHPWWWYLPLLPLLLLPWAAWPEWWRQLRAALGMPEPGLKFCLSWLLAFIPFCIVSAKQPHYLLPLIPACALLIARGAATSNRMSYTGGRWLAMLPLGLLGTVLAAGDLGPEQWHGGWLSDVHPGWGIAVLAAVAWAALPDRLTLTRAIVRIHVATVVSVALIVTALHGSEAGRSYDTRGAAQELARLQESGVVIAYWGEYHGQLGFNGRLKQVLPEVRDLAGLRALVATQPAARVLVVSSRNPLIVAGAAPESAFAYRRKYWSIWSARQLVADPVILRLIRARPRLPQQGASGTSAADPASAGQ